jgi:hypothetical protein
MDRHKAVGLGMVGFTYAETENLISGRPSRPLVCSLVFTELQHSFGDQLWDGSQLTEICTNAVQQLVVGVHISMGIFPRLFGNRTDAGRRFSVTRIRLSTLGARHLIG